MLTSTKTSQAPAQLAQWTQTIKESAMSELLALVTRPDLLSFALGLPATELLPLEACRAAVGRALAADSQALQYHLREEPLKRQIQGLMAFRGVACRTDQVLLTNGAQHAIHLLANLLLGQGAQVVLESVIYEGLHMALHPLQPQIVDIPTEIGSGMDLDALEAKLVRGARPAFIYAITDGHNPLGVSMSQSARVRLVELARSFRVPVVEDDVFGFLSYDNAPLHPVRALDDEWVFYIGSFSKILAPSVRLGWVIVPDAFKPSLSFLKHANDLGVSTLAQHMVSAYLDTGEMPGHLSNLKREYRLRRDTMLDALESYFPPEAQWKKPESGMFIWVELPPEVDTTKLLRVAVETERVAFMPGAIFAAPGRVCARNGIRLNFTHCPAGRIEEGVIRLARVLNKSTGRLA